ncbi:MAG TPA: sugar phosphate nucleotidyltransferase [Candidatus Methanoperedens sp.]|nr:sugar phosphate nucleotidyltransferase [Candidatus Methanoperedens sp.]
MVKKTNKEHYAVILCGGTGPRLWPLSRVDRPKQFLNIFSEKSLLKETFLRAKRIIPKENIFVVTNSKYQNLIKENLKGLVESKNILCEPQKRNTAMAILYACAVISRQNQNAIVTSFPSDHFIGQLNKFDKNIRNGQKLALKNLIITYGIKPNSPSPSFGYIQTNSKFEITQFIEKPQVNIAQKLIQKNNCFWNSGIYTFSVNTLVNEFKQHSKEYLPLFNKLYESYQNPKVVQKIYSMSPSLAIDVAISEKSKKMYLVPANFSWNDVGEWKSIYQELPKSLNNIATLPKNVKYLEVNSKNCLISASPQKMVGLVDVNNLAVIDTPDALLVCNISTDGSFHVRDLVSKIVQNLKFKHFFTGKND